MLPPHELQARIAAEFLRVGASQQSWDQNFPTQPSTWTQDAPNLPPVLTSESAEEYEELAGDFFLAGRGGARVPEGSGAPSGPVPQSGDHLNCIFPSTPQYIAGTWMCVLPDGALVTSDDDWEFPPEFTPGPQGTGTGSPTSPVASPSSSQSGALPAFVGGRLGRVLYTSIANRNITGVRVGTLPRVVMGDVVPGGYGSTAGIAAAGGNIGGGGNDLVQP